MNLSSVTLALIGLATGAALGAVLAPHLRHEPPTALASVPGETPSPPTGAHPLAAKPLPQPAASAPDPASVNVALLLREERNSRLLRELVPFVENLQAADFPSVLTQAADGHGPGRDNLLAALAGRWIELDPQGALACARRGHDRDVTWDIFSAYYGAWAERDPDAAAAAVRQMPASAEHADAAFAVMLRLAARDPAAADDLLQTVRGSILDNGENQQFLYARWAGQDLDAATQSLLQPAKFSNSRAHYEAMCGIVNHLVDTDPPAAVDWLAQLPAGQVRDDARKRLIDQWSRADPAAAMKWLMTTPASDDRYSTVQGVIQKWAGEDPPAAVAYVAALPAGRDKATLEDESISSWAKSDGAAALAWAESRPAADQPQLLDRIIQNWAETDPAAAAKSLASIPAPPPTGAEAFMHTQAFNRIAGFWAATDPAGLSAWLAQLPPGPDRDAATQGYSQHLAESDDPSQALPVAQSIQNPSTRYQAMIFLYQAWLGKAPEAAKRSIQDSSLPPDTQKVLLQPPVVIKND